jgi:hypothetical protein
MIEDLVEALKDTWYKLDLYAFSKELSVCC